MRSIAIVAVLVLISTGQAPGAQHENAVIDLWTAGKTTFGVYVPGEGPRQRGVPPVYTKEGGERLAQNPLYDFVFLNLEGGYDIEAVRAIGEGLRSPSAVSRKTLLVRIPPIGRDGAEVTRARLKEIFDTGADGVVLPHVRSPEEAALAVRLFADAGADVWSPANPSGEKIAMIMIEDPDSLSRVRETADIGGFSILACGIGSLTRALNGDREAAEAGNQRVLAEAKRIGVADMITANAGDVADRVEEGFLALLMQGPSADETDETIEIGRAAAGR